MPWAEAAAGGTAPTNCEEPEDSHVTRPDGAPTPEHLLAEYAERIDAGDFRGVGALFARGRILDGEGNLVAEGAERVTRLYEATTRRYPDGSPRTAHLTTNAIVDIAADGRTAEVRSSFVVLQQTDALGLQPIVAGRYRDHLEHVEGVGWRFTTRQMLPTMFGDVSHHLLFDVQVLTEPEERT